jgi:hypothetical protein
VPARLGNRSDHRRPAGEFHVTHRQAEVLRTVIKAGRPVCQMLISKLFGINACLFFGPTGRTCTSTLLLHCTDQVAECMVYENFRRHDGFGRCSLSWRMGPQGTCRVWSTVVFSEREKKLMSRVRGKDSARIGKGAEEGVRERKTCDVFVSIRGRCRMGWCALARVGFAVSGADAFGSA